MAIRAITVTYHVEEFVEATKIDGSQEVADVGRDQEEDPDHEGDLEAQENEVLLRQVGLHVDGADAYRRPSREIPLH